MTTGQPTPSWACGLPLAAALAALALGGCQCRTAASPTAATKPEPGTISVPFRNRWWHFYERGLSWAEGGRDTEAAADFRQCLELRQTDSRQARTYGMHFVQCFAHRELGAVLLRQRRYDEAERELRLSLEQEPSAKAEHLLKQVAAARSGHAQVAPPVPAPVRERIELASVEPVATAPALVHIAGRIIAQASTTLWCVDDAGTATRLQPDARGAFRAEVPATATLALGGAAGPDRQAVPALPVAPPAAAPELAIDGPDGDAVVADGRAWYRWRAAGAAGLAGLEVLDDSGQRLARCDCAGLRTAGTLRCEIPAGRHTLRFIATDRAGGRTTVERRVESRAGPQQDRSLRAVAMAIPLQTARPGALPAGDDPRLFSALMEDGRFRFVDRRADELLTRELNLVEAGYVDRATAAAAGRRLACRYVIAGTMNRGERDAECFLRLVHCDSGRVVASADAYVELSAAGDADALFAAAAGRLHQTFPVVAGTVSRTASETIRLDRGSRAGVATLMRFHVFAEPPTAGRATKPGAVVEVFDTAAETAEVTPTTGTVPVTGWAVSE